MQSKYLILVGAVTLCTTLGADSITTRNGVIYTNAVIQRADPDGVVIEYAPQPGGVGMAKLKFANLPDELRTRYNYNATDAATFEQNQADGIARRQEAIARGEIEKQRKYDEFAWQRAAKEAALEGKPAAARTAPPMEMGGWYGGYYDDWFGFGTGRRRFRDHSDSPDPDGGTADFSDRVPLSGLGTGWGDSGHFGPLNNSASNRPSHSGEFRDPPRSKPANSSDRSR